MIAQAPAIGCVDYPDESRKSHKRPTARTGGLALWIVLCLAQVLGWLPWHLHPAEWVGIHLMALVGVLDDRLNLRARYKAAVGLGVAVVLAACGAFRIAGVVEKIEFLNLILPSHPLVTFPILVFWFWSIPQAFNLIDGTNGLCMGFGLLALCVLGWHAGAYSAVLTGALLATLLLNFPRALHFLGDCGSLLLGTLLAVLSIHFLVPQRADLPVWIFAYPTIDVTMVVAIRWWNDTPLAQADRNHLHYWMMDHLKGRPWLCAPILLALAALPMLRSTDVPGAAPLSVIGVLSLVGLAIKVFTDRVRTVETRKRTTVAQEVTLQVEKRPRQAPGSQHT